MTTFVPAITSTDVLAQVGNGSSPVFDALLPFGLVLAGIIVGGLLITLIPTAIMAAFDFLLRGVRRHGRSYITNSDIRREQRSRFQEIMSGEDNISIYD